MLPTTPTSAKYSTPQLFSLLIGEGGAGKTVSACSFPKPLILLDFDKGFSAVQNTEDAKGNKIIPDWNEITKVDFFREDYNDLDFKTRDQKSGAPPYTSKTPLLLTRMNKVLQELYTSNSYTDIHNKVVNSGFQTLVIDSITTLFRLWKEMIMHMNMIGHLRIQDYGTLESILFGQFLPSLKAINMKIPYIILIDHIMSDKDEVTGRISEFPVGPSTNMGRTLDKEFDETWIQRIEGSERVWRTRKDGLLNAKSRLHLPEIVKPAMFSSLEEVFKKRKKILKMDNL